MSSVKNIAKIISLGTCLLMASMLRLRRYPAILMYHSFDSVGWKYGVPPVSLKRQLEYLKKHKTIVPLEDIIAYTLQKKTLPDNVVAITVDDGYEDTYSILFPLAKQHQIPFTLFLTTDLSPRENFGNLSRPTWEQLKEMQSSGLMTVGLHGHSHVNHVSVLENDLVEEEIILSEKLIEQKIGVKTDLVAYPSGIHNEKVIELFKDRGYRAGLSIRSGFVGVGEDIFRLPRVEVSRHMSFTMFKLRLTPALLVYNRTILKIKRLIIRPKAHRGTT